MPGGSRGSDAVVRFVSSPTVGAEVLCDLHDDDPWYLTADVSFGAPEFSAEPGAYAPELGYREVSLSLRIDGDSTTARDGLARLAPLVLKPESWLEFRHDPDDDPIFFRTYASAPEALDMTEVYQADDDTSSWVLPLNVPAEGLAIGLREDVVLDDAVPLNPATAGGCVLEVPASKGDVASPLIVYAEHDAWLEPMWWASEPLSVAERVPGGIPAGAYVVQGEAGDTGTDTSDFVVASASNGQASRTTFVVSEGSLSRRSAMPMPAMPAGVYRVIARLRVLDPANTECDVSLYLDSPGMRGGLAVLDRVWRSEPTRCVSPDPDVAVWTSVDLGRMPWPPNVGGSQVGYGEPLVPAGDLLLGMFAARTAGAGSFDVDFFMFLPADHQSGYVRVYSPADGTAVIDGVQKRGSVVEGDDPFDPATSLISRARYSFEGGWPVVHPGGSRLHMLDDGLQSLSGTRSLSASYHPQYLWLPQAGA